MENQTSLSPVSAPPSGKISKLSLLERFSPRFLFAVGISVVALIFVVSASFFYLHRSGPAGPGEVREIYRLVPEKVSKSAAIPIHLPQVLNVSASQAQSYISFEPHLEGKWVKGSSNRELLYQPSVQLTPHKFYTAILKSPEVILQEDFEADEDPKVISIFPKKDEEASEYSEITIIFNRPMVPLTTIDKGVELLPQVKITPETLGKFRWSSTRNLQFIPDTRLERSSHYKIEVGAIPSVEGLAAKGFTHTFTTRPLRQVGALPPEAIPEDNKYIRKGSVNAKTSSLFYRGPLRLSFNQPVDIERTRREIRITKNTGEIIPFIAEYGKRTVDQKIYTDRSIIELFAQKDRFGRERFWDFASSYTITMPKAYPAEGDIVLLASFTQSYATSELISGISATSPRSMNVVPDLFDPQGKLDVWFPEDIDKDKSEITSDTIDSVSYGTKCKEPEAGQEVRTDECEKVPNQQVLELSFRQNKLVPGLGENVIFKKIVNKEGLVLNAEKITRSYKVFPEFKITRTVPEPENASAKLDELVICSNTPLREPDDKQFYERIKSNVSVGLWNWWPSRRVGEEPNRTCTVGEFETKIRYGLAPDTNYTITLNLIDEFDQRYSRTLNFRSGPISSAVRRFQHLQTRYTVTTPERTKLTWAVENLEYVDMSICQISAQSMLTLTKKVNNVFLASLGVPCTRTIQKRIQFSKSRVKQFFQVNLAEYVSDPIGHFVITFTHPKYKETTVVWDAQNQRQVEREGNRQKFERTFLTVTRLVVQEKKAEWSENYYQDGTRKTSGQGRNQILAATLPKIQKNLYWVTEAGTLNPVSAARVDLYNGEFSSVGTFYTGQDGIATMEPKPDLVGAIITKDNDSALISSFTDRVNWAQEAYAAARSYIYTDRPIYRPGQEVFIKGIWRVGYDTNYELQSGKKAQIRIHDSEGKEVKFAEVSLNDYGTFEINLTLDPKAKLGTYSIQGLDGYASFDVEEYSPAAFKLETTSDKEEYIAGDSATVRVSADYYFGVPLEGGEVEYSITAQDYYFDRYQDGYFSFGTGWYYNYNSYYGDRFIARGKLSLENGKAKVTQPLDFGKLFKDDTGNRSKIFVVHLTAKNPNGEAVSTQKSFIVHRGELYLGVGANKTFLAKGEKFKARAKTVDTHGKEISKGGITLELNRIRWETFKRREVDGGYYYRSEQKRELVKKVSLTTDRKGNAEYEASFDKEGEYELVVSTTDSRGNQVSATGIAYVYGEGTVEVRPTNNETLDLATDKNELSVGERAKIIIKSPFPKAKALVSVERGSVIDYYIVDVNGNFADFDFEAKEVHIPNVFVSVLLVSPRPEIKFGQINYRINTKEKELSVEVKTDKNHYLPGETVHLTLIAKDSHGAPIEGEFSIAVADVSVLALKGNPKKNPIVFFYGGMPLTITTSSNVKNELFEAEIPSGTKGGGGGAEPEDLARKRRGVFRDTAFWKGNVLTNLQGTARISFTLSDNLTTWQVESIGVTKDTKLGVSYGEFTTRKSIMALPLKPRFVVPGDLFSLGAKVFNETDSPQTLSISLSSPTLELKSGAPASRTVPPHGSEIVYFEARAPAHVSRGAHPFTISAKNKSFEDTVDSLIAITPNETYEVTATANYTGQNAKEYAFIPDNVVKDRGDVSIKASATLAVYLSDALNFLVDFPYGCSEQIASKLKTLAILKRGLSLKNIGDKFHINDVEFDGTRYTLDEVVDIGLARMYQSQTSEGGFAYYKALPANFYLTLHVLETLAELRDSGYIVDREVMNRAADFVVRSADQDPELLRDRDFTVIAASIVSRLPGFEQSSRFRTRALDLAGNRAYLREEISSTALAHLALLSLLNFPADLKNEVLNALEARIQIDSRGAYLGTNAKRSLWAYYETPIKDTALLLKAYAAARYDSPVLDKIVRWIIRSRAKDGAWGTTNNTVSVIDAFVEFLQWKKEHESQFDLGVLVNGKEEKKFEFNKDTILDVFSHSISLKTLGFGKIASVELKKTAKNSSPNNFYYDMAFKYYLPMDAVGPRDEGFAVERAIFSHGDSEMKTTVSSAHQGDVLRVRLRLTTPEFRNFVALEDFIPAGTEIINFNLETSDRTLGESNPNEEYQPSYPDRGDATPKARRAHFGSIFDYFRSTSPVSPRFTGEELSDELYGSRQLTRAKFYPDSVESHDDRVFLFKQNVEPGTYEYQYFLRALVPGTFNHLPARAGELYFPENFGRTRGEFFTIEPR